MWKLTGNPFFFLGGPIRGGGDWQQRMTRFLHDAFGDSLIVANPSRYTESHPLYRFRMSGEEDKFDRQLSWERHYLEYAGKRSHTAAIIFWLECQKEKRAAADGPYAQDTYGELGEWRGRMAHEMDINFLIGAEDGFPGLSQIQRNFNSLLKRDVSIHPTMEALVAEAVGLVQ